MHTRARLEHIFEQQKVSTLKQQLKIWGIILNNRSFENFINIILYT